MWVMLKDILLFSRANVNMILSTLRPRDGVGQ